MAVPISIHPHYSAVSTGLKTELILPLPNVEVRRLEVKCLAGTVALARI